MRATRRRSRRTAVVFGLCIRSDRLIADEKPNEVVRVRDRKAIPLELHPRTRLLIDELQHADVHAAVQFHVEALARDRNTRWYGCSRRPPRAILNP
jgi:hypothetical protein